MVPDQMHQSKSDSELRQTFGITADLSVSVEKIDVSKESQALEYHAQDQKRLINKRTLDGIRKLIHESKINTKVKQLIQTQVRFLLMFKINQRKLYQSCSQSIKMLPYLLYAFCIQFSKCCHINNRNSCFYSK